jgi:hypothetical protein
MRLFHLTLALICTLWTAIPLPSAAQAETPPLKAFFFGNSLVHHREGLPLTSTPYWLNQIAKARGSRLEADGSWGFLPDHARQLPPDPNWKIAGGRGVWERRRGGLGQSGISAVVLSAENYLQYQSPEAVMPGNNPANLSAVAASLPVLDWANADRGSTEMRFFLYQGWADMEAVVNSFPPDRAGYTAYLDAQGGAYDQWYHDYAATLHEARPELQIELLPIATSLVHILQLPALEALEPIDLFSDDAPHGTPTLYFLAAMISYGPMFQDTLPSRMELPATIHPLVRQNYSVIAATIGAGMAHAQRPLKVKAREPQPTQPQPAAHATHPDRAPALGIGLQGIADWSTQMPFIDQIKSARPWIGHKTGQWGGMDADQLRAAGALSPAGWPQRLPEGVERLETFVLADLPPDAALAAGRYRMRYTGKGRIQLLGRARNVSARHDGSRGEMWFDFTPGEGLVAISIAALDTTDPIRDIEVIHERHLPYWAMGETFNPDWLSRIENMRVVRFMDWMGTNDSPIRTWGDRPRPQDYSYSWRGVPLEVMLDLANRIGADPWFNMPHRADDTYVRRFATQVEAGLNPQLKAYVEYSNEVWNFIFSQAEYAGDQAVARWGEGVRDTDAWMQWAGLRAAEVAAIWADVFGADAPTRLTRVIATHTGWPGLEEPLLTAPLYTAEDRSNQPPVAQFDAYAVTGYFGHALGSSPQADQVKGWLRLGQTEAQRRAYALLKSGEVRSLVNETFPYHANVAAKHGLPLIMYEGGTHIVADSEWQGDTQLTAFFAALNYSEEVASLYEQVIEGWQAAGGTLFNAFVDVGAPSKWGSWGGLRHLGDDNPRWQALHSANANLPTSWEARDPAVFQQLRSQAGSDRDDLLTGSTGPDLMIAHNGNDWLISNGGGDRLHGGDGVDTAVLPGAATDYQLNWTNGPRGRFLIAESERATIYMHAIEQLEFAAEQGRIYRVSAP